jgi:hypoxanthine phosphoribosyltransferase
MNNMNNMNNIEIRSSDVNKITHQIQKSDWYPDIIIGPKRETGVMLSKHYNKPFFMFSWNKNIRDYYVIQQIIEKNTNKNILVVDDINSTGKTLLEIEKTINTYIELGKFTKGDKLSNQVKYAVLFNTENSEFKNVSYVANVLTN